MAKKSLTYWATSVGDARQTVDKYPDEVLSLICTQKQRILGATQESLEDDDIMDCYAYLLETAMPRYDHTMGVTLSTFISSIAKQFFLNRNRRNKNYTRIIQAISRKPSKRLAHLGNEIMMRDFLRQFDFLTAAIGYFWLFETLNRREISELLEISPAIVSEKIRIITAKAA